MAANVRRKRELENTLRDSRKIIEIELQTPEILMVFYYLLNTPRMCVCIRFCSVIERSTRNPSIWCEIDIIHSV